MTSALVCDRELHDLVEDLDAAVTALESCGYRDAHDDALTLPLRNYFQLKQVLEAAADYLAAIRFCGGRP
jgi:hypothetical protein